MAYKYRDTQAISIEPVTETGSIVTFENPDDVIGITSLIADIDPIQDGTPWVSPDNTAPYLLRQSPQYGNEYNNEFDTLIGGSIAWNQLVQNGNFADTSNWTMLRDTTAYQPTLSVSNNVATATVKNSGDRLGQSVSMPLGHKMLISAEVLNEGAVDVHFWWTGSRATFPQSSSFVRKTVIVQNTSSNVAPSLNFRITQNSSTEFIFKVRNVVAIDLTALFANDPSIADYVYSLEQSTAGSGIAWLKSYGFLTKDYYAYDTGGLVSVKTTAHVMRDEDDAIIGNYPLDSDLELRGIPKLSNGSLYYDGDEYTVDGTVNRLYRRYTSSTTHTDEYGTLGSGVPYYGIILSNASDKIVYGNTKDMVCNLGYIALGAGETSVSGGFRVYDENEFIFYDTRFTSKAVAQQLLADLEIVYKAKTPTTENADSFASPQIVSPLGTEEYVDTRSVPVPVGHRTVYKNIAPISGYSEINIYVSPTEDAEDATVYPVDLNGTRYGKQMNITTGQLEVCPYYASYNGETLTGEWMSDRDVYAPGTTPSIGAQVVNIGGTLTTEQLLPTDIKTLVDTNYVWSDSGDITLTYAVDPSLYITLPKEAVSMDGRYLERMIDGYTTLYVKGRESLGIELNTYSVGTADGERVKGSRYPSRTLTIGFQLLCEDEVEFRAKFNQLNNLLSIGRADFIFADEPTMFFTGTPVMDATIEPGRNNVTGEWKLYCDYPFKRSVEPTVLSSTDSDVLVGDHEATFVFDYKGVMPAKPILRCEFDSTKSGGDYSEDGDCGFVAFLNQDENIIQLGNPEIIDLDSINKSATLINSEFSSLANWTVDGMTAGNIVDPYWNNGEGQTQSYAKGIGTLSRTTTGAIDFDFSIVHRLCVNASSQTGAFKVDLTNDGDTIVGFAIEKTGNGTSATVSYIVNGIVVGTDNIDISYNNANFGFCSRTEYFVVTDINGKETILTKDNYYRKKFGFYDDFFGFGGFRHGSQIRRVRREYDYSQSNLNSRISRNGNAVTFQIGNLAKRTFKNNDIENVPCYDVKFETTGNFDTNAIRSCSFIRKTGVAFAKIPNVFTAGDIVEADCNSANVFMYRNGSLVGHLEPQYGALGNNWEDFNIKVGHNIIRAVWSEWSNPAYKPVIKIIFNEVYI